MHRARFAVLSIALLVITAPGRAAEDPGGLALTIYSTAKPGAIPPEWYRPIPESMGGSQMVRQIPGYAVIKQEREFDVAAGRGTLRFSDVAALIDPTTVSFLSLTDPAGTQVLEQNYQFDLVSTQKLMERYIDREISIEQSRGNNTVTLKGTLLSTAGGLVLRDKDGGVTVVNGYSSAGFPSLPGGLMTRPTLVWDIHADKGGKQKTRVSYQTTGITWWTDYNIVFSEGKDANSGQLDIGAWVSILNGSGAGYPEARLKLIAGDVHRAPQPAPPGVAFRGEMLAMRKSEARGFEEKAFFEYHLYTLGRPATLPENSTKQIELFETARGVPCEKVLVYYGLGGGFPGWFGYVQTDRNYGVQSNKKVDIYLQFKNSKEIGMGMPLPSGRIRVSKSDPADDTLEFIGEDVIDHTSRDELVRIKLGEAFDVVGERRQVDFRIDTTRKTIDEEIEVKVRNHKEEPVKVIVRESLFRGLTWEITKKSAPFEKVDAHTIHFPVTIPKDGEAVVRYTVHYSW